MADCYLKLLKSSTVPLSASVIKVHMAYSYASRHLKEQLAWAMDKYFLFISNIMQLYVWGLLQ